MGSGLPGSVPGPEGCDAGTHSISVPQRSVRPFTGVPLPVTLSHAPSRYQRQGPTHDRLTVLNPGFLMSGGVRARRTSVYLKRVPSGCRCHRTCGRSGARRGQSRRARRSGSEAWDGAPRAAASSLRPASLQRGQNLSRTSSIPSPQDWPRIPAPFTPVKQNREQLTWPPSGESRKFLPHVIRPPPSKLSLGNIVAARL